MKLRNKKNGEIGYLIVGKGSDHYVVANNEWNSCGKYDSLAELNEEWGDYEEPKVYWYIMGKGEIRFIEDEGTDFDNNHKEIGNYFSSREEAEKAVEKLKAWKRLKDSGFRFNGGDDCCISYRFDTAKWNDKLVNDFDLLFGGEE